MDQSIKLSKDDSDLLPDLIVFQYIIGRMLYLTITRSDLSYSIHRLSQCLAQPQLPQLHAVFRIPQHLKISIGLSLLLLASNSITLKTFGNLDWTLILITVGLFMDIVCILVIF